MVDVHLEPAKEQRLRELADSQGKQVSELAQHVIEEYLDQADPINGTSNLSNDQATLLQEINQGLPEAAWQRYHELMDRRRDESLTADEHEELKRLTDKVEVAHAQRMERVVKLAQLRGVVVDELMDSLGLRDPGYV